jgi:hypothetical protein
VGSAALRPTVELLPVPALTVKRQFSVGATTLTLSANLEVDLRPPLLRYLRYRIGSMYTYPHCLILSTLKKTWVFGNRCLSRRDPAGV